MKFGEIRSTVVNLNVKSKLQSNCTLKGESNEEPIDIEAESRSEYCAGDLRSN
jgi:hypothetical protein